jgi:hypothetical protein
MKYEAIHLFAAGWRWKGAAKEFPSKKISTRTQVPPPLFFLLLLLFFFNNMTIKKKATGGERSGFFSSSPLHEPSPKFGFLYLV